MRFICYFLFFHFVGWSQEIPTNMPAENITLKAQWEKVDVNSMLLISIGLVALVVIAGMGIYIFYPRKEEIVN